MKKYNKLNLTLNKTGTSIKNNYKQKILAFDVRFDENNEAALLNIDKTKRLLLSRLYKKEITTEKAAPALKLLMSTVPKNFRDENGDIKELKSSIGGAILLPSSQVYITLMRNLSDSTSINDMLKRLRELAKNDINYRPVFKRFTGIDYTKSVAEI